MTTPAADVLADPAGVIVDLVASAELALDRTAITAVVTRVAGGRARQRRLARCLAGRPSVLADGRSPASEAAGELLVALRQAGAVSISLPVCATCGKQLRSMRRRGQDWYCTACGRRPARCASCGQPCARCGAVREAATRDEAGRPLCSNCLVTDPANQETCATCGRRRRVSIRTADGPLCDTCRPRQVLTCHICGRQAPCQVSRATGKPRCRACTKRCARCAGCGQTRPVRGGSRDQPLCSACTLPGPGPGRSCPGCGQPGRLYAGRCARCTIRQRLRDLLGDEHGQIPAGLQGIYQALAAVDRPATVASWLDRSTAPAVLRNLRAGQRSLTHQALDELPAGKTVEHLRSVLVATGTLPPRDEQLTRLERWITRAIAGRPDPGQQQLLHRYAIWHVVRRLRSRLGGAHATYSQAVAARRNIKAAAVLLDWLTARGLTLATARQADLDAWLSSEHATYRADAGNFIRWASNHKLTRLDAPAARWSGPSGVIDTETRWEQARRLLHDDTLKPDDRVAGLLVLLYAQWPAAISRLTLGHVDTRDDQVRIQLGREPVVLPEPLDALVLQLAATRHGHAAIGDSGTSPWLFPGGQPGQPISAYQLAERLRQLGIRSGQSRSAALFQLATDLPAAILARLLGIHISVAVAWQRASAGDWAAYAAEVSRRARKDDNQ